MTGRLDIVGLGPGGPEHRTAAATAAVAGAEVVIGYEPYVAGSNSYDETAGSEVVVITAGLPRSPGMSRDDLVTTNEKIVGSVTEQVVAQSPDAILIIVSNPLDAMCHVARNVSKWDKQRVLGMAGILDTSRFRAFIAFETGASIKDVQTLVLGGHGDQMVPLVSATTVVTGPVGDREHGLGEQGGGLAGPLEGHAGGLVGNLATTLGLLERALGGGLRELARDQVVAQVSGRDLDRVAGLAESLDLLEQNRLSHRWAGPGAYRSPT